MLPDQPTTTKYAGVVKGTKVPDCVGSIYELVNLTRSYILSIARTIDISISLSSRRIIKRPIGIIEDVIACASDRSG